MTTMTRRTALGVSLVAALAAATAGVVYYQKGPDGGGGGERPVVVVLPLTGAAASWGEHFKRGADMYEATYPDRRLKLRVIDSQSNPTTALTAVQQACAGERPYAIVSTVSAITVPLRGWAKDEDTFLVACVISDKVLEQPGKVQRVYPSVQSNAAPIARYARARYRRVAVLHSNEELGQAVRREFEKDFVGDGRTTEVEGYAVKEAEVRTLVTKVLRTNPEATLVTGFGPSFWAIIRELHGQGYKGQVLSDASFADPVQIAQLGPAAEGVIFVGSETELTAPRTEAAQKFNTEFSRRFGVNTNYGSVTVYEALVMLDRLSRTTPELQPTSFLALGDWNGVPGTIKLLPNGDCQYPWFLMKRTEGKVVPLAE